MEDLYVITVIMYDDLTTFKLLYSYFCLALSSHK